MTKNKKSKNKLRVAFRKNRQKPARHNKINADILDDDLATDALVYDERLSGKGNLSRHRTVIADDEESSDVILQREINKSSTLAGRVIRATGLNSIVQTDDGKRYECTTRRVVRTMQRDQRNAVVAGDLIVGKTNLITGHNPGVSELILYLSGDRVPHQASANLMPTAAITVLKLLNTEDPVEYGGWQIIDYMKPRLLP